MSATRRVSVLGVGVDPFTLTELLHRVDTAIDTGQPTTIAYANVHVLNTAWSDPALRAFLRDCTVCYCDGTGVQLGARLRGQRLPERMTGADWIWNLAAHCEGRRRLYWVGGRPGVARRAAEALRARHPALEIETDHGYHDRDGDQDRACIDRINEARPDIVLVGMGTPEQERWTQARRDRIQAPVVWCLGATADFVAGEIPRGPAWLVKRAEWLARLFAEPRRLAGRYLVGNVLFVGRVLGTSLGASPRD